ncbi:Tetratricopeptide repeat protein 21B [Taenia solium]|eukprot:TsM_000225400 transcript=TsM_000225400 gene=TsM_000225400
MPKQQSSVVALASLCNYSHRFIDDSPFLERSWLLLADIYVGMDKRDMAVDLLKRCLQYNQSCYQACEFMGVVAEKNNSYEDAAMYYNTAWEILNKQDLAIGKPGE